MSPSRPPILQRPIGKWVLTVLAVAGVASGIVYWRILVYRRSGSPILVSRDAAEPSDRYVRLLGVPMNEKGGWFVELQRGGVKVVGDCAADPPSEERVMVLGKFAGHPGQFRAAEWWTPTPADLVNRNTWFEGSAEIDSTGPVLKGDGWSVRIADLAAWSDSVLHKRVRVDGDLKRAGGRLVFQNAAWHLVDLVDLFDTHVALEGRAWSMNGDWWFAYRGARVHIQPREGAWPPTHLLGGGHGSPCCIRGVLRRPDVVQMSLDPEGAAGLTIEDLRVTDAPPGTR